VLVGVTIVAIPNLRHKIFHAVGLETWETLPDTDVGEFDADAATPGTDPTPAEDVTPAEADPTPAEADPTPAEADPTPAEADPTPAEDVTPAAADPTPAEVVTPPVEPPTPAEPVEPEQVVLQLNHRPITSHARGQDITVTFTIEPDVRTMCTLSYRAVPGGAWVEKLYVGAHGTVSTTIAAGDWQGPDASRVEYFIQLSGRYGEASSGTAASPHVVSIH